MSSFMGLHSAGLAEPTCCGVCNCKILNIYIDVNDSKKLSFTFQKHFLDRNRYLFMYFIQSSLSIYTYLKSLIFLLNGLNRVEKS